jgi:hypothetical protein
MGVVPCPEAVDIVDETRIKNKITAVETKVIEYAFSFFFIYSTYHCLSNIFHSKNINN